jgi:mannose-6-phosphate isomerase-like protein (cupin superfamily)
MYSINEEDVKLQELKGRDYKLLASEDTLGCKNLCMGVSFFPPQKHGPSHMHEIEEEVIYCLEGEGEIVIDDNPVKIKPGIVVYIPTGKIHSVNNLSNKTIKLIYIFSPSTKIGSYKDL